MIEFQGETWKRLPKYYNSVIIPSSQTFPSEFQRFFYELHQYTVILVPIK